MSSNQLNWEHVLSLPNPPVAALAREFEGYSFGTSGFGDDFEVEVTQLPSERATLDATTNPAAHPTLPFIDFSTMPACTPTSTHPGTLTIMGPPPTPTPRSRFALADLNTLPPSPFNLDDPHFGLTPDRKRVVDDETRRLIGNSGAVKEKGRKTKKNQENPDVAADGSTKVGKSVYTGDDLIAIARASVDINPWIAPHGRKGPAWDAALALLVNQKGFRHPNMTASTLQHKAEAMVSFKKDPHGKNKNLANVIGDGTSAAITIAALLERMETQYDEAKDKTDDAKAILKKKNDTDREGGEAIRQASMRAMRRKRSPSPDSDDEDKTETEPEPVIADAAPTAPAAGAPATPVSASSSAETIDSNTDKRKYKRRRLAPRPASDALLGVMREENRRRADYDNRVAASLDAFVKDSREQKAEFASLLRDLIASDRN
ncbi:hypothetical protein B0H13DRAFT_2677249 [Mycena leptocephala]|nr:hypothetical protein B0H13DRAFT_2677249 [Mycena leptocephala]